MRAHSLSHKLIFATLTSIVSASFAMMMLAAATGHAQQGAKGGEWRYHSGDLGSTSYSPLYQVGYMIGGLQLRALHHVLVDAKCMTDRDFHDAVKRLLGRDPAPERAWLRAHGRTLYWLGRDP